jgi:ribosomal protein S6
MIELVQSEITRQYELTYLLPNSLKIAEVSQAQAAVVALVAKFDGAIETTEDWGKKETAYAIRHSGSDQNEALYTHLLFSMPAKNAQALERELQLNTQVMRHLLILAEPAVISTESRDEERA